MHTFVNNVGLIKGTVAVVSSSSPFVEWHAPFTPVPLTDE